MRIFCILIFVLCLSFNASAMNPAFLHATGTESESIPYAGCAEIESYEFAWFGDHATSTVTACKSGGTITGVLSGSTIVDSDVDPGTGSPVSDDYCLKTTAAAQYLQFAITAGDIFNSSEGYLKFHLYAATTSGENTLMHIYTDANNYLLVVLNADNTVSIDHNGNEGSNRVTMDSSDTVSDTTWTLIEIRWSVTNNKVSIKIAGGSWLDDADGDAVAAFTSEPSTVKVAYTVNNDDIYIDNVYIDTVSGI